MVVVLASEAMQPGIAHDDLLLLVLQLALLLGLARLLGMLAARMGMPEVVGELSAGVIVGPSIFGNIAPGAREWLFPTTSQAQLLAVPAFLGVLLLLILTGLETDLGLIKAKGRTAGLVSAGGIVVPFASGLALGYAIPAVLVPADTPRTTFALFLGTALSISAIPVIAKVLIELRVIRRDIGQLTLAAGMIDDTVGWILLSIVAGLASSGELAAGAVVGSIARVVGFLVVSYTLGGWLVSRTLRAVSRRAPGPGPLISAVVVLALLFAAVSQALQIEAVLGAFVLGILAGRERRVDHRVVHSLESLTLTVFAPLFFASAGLLVDLGALLEPTTLWVAALVLTVAIAGKFLGAFAGASVAGLGRWEALALGAGMNARGALEIIIATIGLSLGVLTEGMFAIIVLVAIVTSLMAPPILVRALRRVPMSPEEAARLQREAASKTSLLDNVHRVLLPSRGGTNSQLAAQLLSRIAVGRSFDVTVLAGGPDPQEIHGRITRHLSLHGGNVELAAVDGDDPASAILDRARRGGHDLIVLGATETRTDAPDSALFSATVDRVLMDSPVPLLLVSSRFDDDAEVLDPRAPERILLVSTGEDINNRAGEIAFAVASDPESVVDVVHVVEPPQSTWAEIDLTEVGRARELADELATKQASVGLAAGVTVRTDVRISDEPLARVVADAARAIRATLVVIRSDVQPVTRRAFLGHELDQLLREAPCPVLVITRA